MFTLWNTLHRKREELVTLELAKVGIYTCGPTVYDRVHIGNLRAFLFEDTLRRTLSFLGYQVTQVMNITDVGHLVSDGDEGEDKMEKGSRKMGKTAWEVARECEEWFLKDMEVLRMQRPEFMPRATEHIPEQIEMIKVLEEKGFAYRTSDGMYFDTAKLPSYGKLSGQKLDEKEAGARVEVNEEKRNPTDFALWKFTPPNVKWQMEWETPWGKGCPGWHLECSAMSVKYLGQPFDIHCGGVDHIPVHHENEIAQSEGAYGKPLANYWMHNEFILVDGQKMSKSLGNGYTIVDIQAKGFDPLAFRYFCLGAHYRSKLNFTWEGIQAAQNGLQRLQRLALLWVEEAGNETAAPDEASIAPFREALEDDLNSPKALAAIWKMVDESSLTAAQKLATLREMDRVLGFGFGEKVHEEIPREVLDLQIQRDEARLKKDWPASDALRQQLQEKGWNVEDLPQGKSKLVKRS